MKSFISLWEYSLDCQRKFLDISITLFSFDIFVRALTLYEFWNLFLWNLFSALFTWLKFHVGLIEKCLKQKSWGLIFKPGARWFVLFSGQNCRCSNTRKTPFLYFSHCSDCQNGRNFTLVWSKSVLNKKVGDWYLNLALDGLFCSLVKAVGVVTLVKLCFYTFLTVQIVNFFRIFLYMIFEVWVSVICSLFGLLASHTITWMANSFMLWLNILFQVSFLCCYIFTLITWIANSVVLWLCMLFHFMLLYSHTDHMNSKFLHAVTLHVVSGGLSVLLWNHTDHMNGRLLHAATLHVVSGSISMLFYSHIYHKNSKLLHAVTLRVVSGQVSMLHYSHTDHMISFVSLWEHFLDCHQSFCWIIIL